MTLLFIIIVTLAVLMLVYMVWSLRNGRRKLSSQAHKKIMALWFAMEQMHDPVRKVMEADAIFDRALKELGYEGALGDKLKAAGPHISNLDAVWSAHKLRNRLAHEPGGAVSDSEVKGALSAFKKALKSFS
ncbi:hypothetical protein KKC44_00460 [Patescibacteria group bacterium]|nr:hypothetical protein [Patescibacteria group bacterium]MBU2259058.1 hypothetical protein [Patescibacteria group bacterium]